jgi:hypothetical protein
VTWNPHAAYPRQTTYVPDVGLRVPRAINAPPFGSMGTRGVTQQPLTSAYLNIARNAASIATGAAGSGAHIRGLAAREGSVAGGLVDNLHRRGAQARSQLVRGLGRNNPASDEMYARGADVVASAMTPLSATWDPETAPPLMQGRANQPWDTLLDPGAEPRFDPMGRRDPSTMASSMPRITSRGRPRPRQVTNPFDQPLF